MLVRPYSLHSKLVETKDEILVRIPVTAPLMLMGESKGWDSRQDPGFSITGQKSGTHQWADPEWSENCGEFEKVLRASMHNWIRKVIGFIATSTILMETLLMPWLVENSEDTDVGMVHAALMEFRSEWSEQSFYTEKARL